MSNTTTLGHLIVPHLIRSVKRTRILGIENNLKTFNSEDERDPEEKYEEVVVFQGGPQKQGYVLKKEFKKGEKCSQVKNPNMYIASKCGHVCRKYTNGYVFYSKKEKKRLNKNSWDVPTGKEHEFCSNCRKIEKSEFKEYNIRGSVHVDCWLCMCS